MQYSLRSRYLLAVPRFNTNYIKNSKAYKGATLWNAINASKDKNFSNAKFKNIKKRLSSLDIFCEFNLINITLCSIYG